MKCVVCNGIMSALEVVELKDSKIDKSLCQRHIDGVTEILSAKKENPNLRTIKCCGTCANGVYEYYRSYVVCAISDKMRELTLLCDKYKKGDSSPLASSKD